jgi:hypothetical protein
MKRQLSYSRFFKPFATVDNRIDFHYLARANGYVFGVVIDNKVEYELRITPSGRKMGIIDRRLVR